MFMFSCGRHFSYQNSYSYLDNFLEEGFVNYLMSSVKMMAITDTVDN
jgi:hypothetical protein